MKIKPLATPLVALIALGAGAETALCIAAPPRPAPAVEKSRVAKPELVLQIAHSEDVTQTAFSRDGKHLITSSIDGTLKWWDIEKSELLMTVNAHQGRLFALSAAPDGETIASTGDVGGVKLWNTRTGRLVRALAPESGAVPGLAFSSDGSTFACAGTWGENSEVRIWNTRNWELQKTLEVAEARSELALSDDGSLVAVGAIDSKMAGVWETRADKLRFSLGEQPGIITALAFAPKRAGETFPILATTNAQLRNNAWHSEVHLWNAQTGRELRTLTQSETTLRELAFSRDGNTLALGEEASENAPVQLWDVKGEAMSETTLRQTISLPRARLGRFSFSPDGHLLAGGISGSGRVMMFDTRSGQVAHEILSHQNSNPVSAVSLSGGRLTMIGESSSQEWDATTGAATRPLKQLSRNALSPDNKLLAVFNYEGIRVENAELGWLVQSLPASQKGVAAEFVLFSPDSRILLTRDHQLIGNMYHELLRLWDARTGQLLHKLDIAGYDGRQSNTVAFSPDSALLAVGGGGLVQLWDVKSGQMRAELHSPVRGRREGPIVFSRDGRRLAAAVRMVQGETGSSVIKVWDVASGKLEKQIPDAGELATALSFSADGALLAVGERYGDIAVRGVATGKILQTLQSHAGMVNSVSFSEDAAKPRLASGGQDGTTKIWDAVQGKLLATFQILRSQWSEGEPQRVLRDWIVTTPAGYYNASAEASPFIRWKAGDELLPVANDESAFRRPDRVQQALTGK